MAWNEPGGGQRDPWGRDKRPGGGGGSPLAWLRQWSSRAAQPFNNPRGVVTFAVVLVVVWMLLTSYVVIGAAQSGVVLRLGAYARTLGPGFHLKLPSPLERVVRVNTGQVRSVDDTVRFLTRDQDMVSIGFAVQYRITDARQYLYASSDADGAMQAEAEAAVRGAVGGATLDQLLADDGVALAGQARQALEQELAHGDDGVAVTDLTFQSVSPPPEAKDAFDDVANARQDAQTAEIAARAYAAKALPAAHADADANLAAANGYKAERIARAQGETGRFELVLQAYRAAPEVTRKRMWLETMEDVLGSGQRVIDASGGRSIINLAPAASASPSHEAADAVPAAVASAATPADTDDAADAKEKQP